MPLMRAAAPRPEIAADPPNGVEAERAGATKKLAEILSRDSNPLAREAALTGLARIGDDEAIRALVGLLGTEDPRLRNAIIETLPSLGERVIDHIETMLSDADPSLRVYALTALQPIAAPRAAEVALRVALADPHINVCAAAVEVVAKSGTPEMAGALQSVPARFPDHPFLRFAVQAALEEIG